MNVREEPAGSFDLEHCIALLEGVLERCDAAHKSRAAIHIHQAIESLKRDRD